MLWLFIQVCKLANLIKFYNLTDPLTQIYSSPLSLTRGFKIVKGLVGKEDVDLDLFLKE